MTTYAKDFKQADWCLTLFDVQNRTNHIERLKASTDEGSVRYFVEGYEICPETGRHHIHVYIYWKSKRSFSAVKKDYPFAHIESRKAEDVQQAVDYVKKDDTKRFPGDWSEYGTQPVDKRGKVNSWPVILEDIKKGMSMEEITEKYVEEAIRYANGIKSMYELHRPKHKFNILDKYGKYNKVQEEILSYVESPTHDREIYWVYDQKGGVGKTDLANHLISNNGFLVFGNAKTADVALAWNGQNVIFDYSRSQQDHINYGVIEDIKNGRIFSGKYQSCTKLYARPKVLVFANFLPDTSKMSEDRWNIVSVKNNTLQQHII